jgi:type I restriction enzyme R subunit
MLLAATRSPKSGSIQVGSRAWKPVPKVAANVRLGDDTLAQIARALVADIRKNLSVDWLAREPVRAKLRTRIRRLLARFDYPPEEEREAVDLVLKQMETFAKEWSPQIP